MKSHLNCFGLSHRTGALCCWELWLIQIPGKVKWASQSWLYWCPWVTLGPDCICSLVQLPVGPLETCDLTPIHIFSQTFPELHSAEESFHTGLCSYWGWPPLHVHPWLWAVLLAWAILLERWEWAPGQWRGASSVSDWGSVVPGAPLDQRLCNHFSWRQFRAKVALMCQCWALQCCRLQEGLLALVKCSTAILEPLLSSWWNKWDLGRVV